MAAAAVGDFGAAKLSARSRAGTEGRMDGWIWTGRGGAIGSGSGRQGECWESRAQLNAKVTEFR